MLNFLSTIGAQSQFEKNRLILTRLNLDAPNQQSMKNILTTFAGENQHTRAQIALATIIRKIHISKQKDNWVYLIKNLIILDRVMTDNQFCQQISELKLTTVENYQQNNTKNVFIKSQQLLKKYWNIIRQICILKTSKKHILHYKRYERKTFIDHLHPKQILKQITELHKLFKQILELIYITSGITLQNQQNLRRTEIFIQKKHKNYQQFIKSTLAQYLTIHFYSKLFTLFSCQYILIHKFIQIIIHSTENDQHVIISDAIYFKKIVTRFKLICNDMVLLTQRNQNKKGFEQIDIKQFTTFSQKNIIKVIDQYIHHHNSQPIIFQNRKVEPLMKHNVQNNNNELILLKVEKKPLFYGLKKKKSQKSARKLIQKQIQLISIQVFEHYFNSYSSDFPHKKIMTLDLIQDIRRQSQITNIQSHKSIRMTQFPQLENENTFEIEYDNLKSKTKWKDLIVLIQNQKQIQNDQVSTNQNEEVGSKLSKHKFSYDLIFNPATRQTSI